MSIVSRLRTRLRLLLHRREMERRADEEFRAHIEMETEDLTRTLTKAAKVLGVSRQALNNVVNARAAITPEMAVRLAKAFGSSAETWLRMQMAYDLAEVSRRENQINVKRNNRKRSSAA